MVARDQHGTLRQEAGAPASQGGRFATEPAPAAATALQPQPPTVTERAVDAHWARVHARAAAAIDTIHAEGPDDLAAIRVTFGTDLESNWANIEAATDERGQAVALSTEQEDAISEALLRIGVGTHRMEELFDDVHVPHAFDRTGTLRLARRGEFDRTSRTLYAQTSTTHPYSKECVEEVADALWAAHRYSAAATALDAIRQQHPDASWVEVEIIASDDDDSQYVGDGITSTWKPIDSNTMALVSDIGLKQHDAAGQLIWQHRVDGDEFDGRYRLAVADVDLMRSRASSALDGARVEVAG